MNPRFSFASQSSNSADTRSAESLVRPGARIPFAPQQQQQRLFAPDDDSRLQDGVPLPSVKRIGATDPFYMKAAHPARFTQQQHDRTGVAVYNDNDPGGPKSLAAISAEEKAKRRMIAGASQNNCAQLKHVLVMVDGAQANAARCCATGEKSGADAQAALETVSFIITLPTPMTDLVAHRLINGQIRSWEIELLLRCQRDPRRIEALIEAPINAAPIVGEDRYVLGITETYPITKRNRTIHFDIAGSNCPALELPLTLVQLESVVWFAACLGGDRNPAWEGGDAERIVYLFRTKEPHGYVPGLLFFFISSGCAIASQECDVPQDADRFLVLDATQCGDDCFEFLALRCTAGNNESCKARRARVFDPFDQECRFARCGRLHIDVPRCCQECLRGYECPCPQAGFCPTNVNDNNNSQCLGCVRFDCCCPENGEQLNQLNNSSTTRCRACASGCRCAYVYVPPPNTPNQVALLVNGVLDHTAECGESAFETLGVEVDYDCLIDQFVTRSVATQQCSYSRSLFGDRCAGAQSLNFPLTRRVMVAAESTPEARQAYLQRTLSHFYYFPVRTCVNDRFFVRFECAPNPGFTPIILPPGNYAARFFVQVLQTALDAAFEGKAPFNVRYELFDTERLVQAQIDFRRSCSGKTTTTAAMFAAQNGACASLRTGPYTPLTFVIFIESADCNLFTLNFDCNEQSRAFARLIDYDPSRRYELQSIYAGNALSQCSAGGCDAAHLRAKWYDFACKSPCCVSSSSCCDDKCVPSTADYCAPAPRRTYTASVDPATSFVTLEQRIQRPFQVERLPLPPAAGGCSGVRYQIVPREPGCEPQPMFCAGDVVIVSPCNPLCAPSGELCGCDEVLNVIVSEQRYDQFTLANDAFPNLERVWVWTAPVGFNVHLHRAVPPQDCAMKRYDAENGYQRRTAAQGNVVTRWLGFASPATKSGAFCYTSDHYPAPIVDESLLIRVPSLLCLSEGRNTLYSPVSPFDDCMTEFYSQLVLDRNAGQYRTYPALTAPLPQLSAPANVLPTPGASNQPTLNQLQVTLLRPDGTVYHACGFDLNLTFELVYINN